MLRITIAGRANVGKSTLFNRLLGKRTAVTAFEEGTTRDSIECVCDFFNTPVLLTDTAGLLETPSDQLSTLVQQKLSQTLSGTDIFLMVVNGREEPTASDIKMAKRLLSYNKPLILVLNKIDNQDTKSISSWQNWMIKDLIKISAVNGRNIDALSDAINMLLTHDLEKDNIERLKKIVIIGRPNVGKSSLINAILESDRLIASPIPGTTRDVIPIRINEQNFKFTMLDTPGIRRRGRIEVGAEKFGFEQTKNNLAYADAVIIVIDGHEGATRQDVHIVTLAAEIHLPILLVYNKVDLVETHVTQRFPYLKKYPHIFVSAKTSENIQELREYIQSLI